MGFENLGIEREIAFGGRGAAQRRDWLRLLANALSLAHPWNIFLGHLVTRGQSMLMVVPGTDPFQ
jgi:hypothetical protein